MEFHVKYLVYWTRSLPEIDFSQKSGQNGLMVPNFIGICSVLFDIERRLTDGAQLPLHLL